MRVALEEGRQAAREGEIPVGAVVVSPAGQVLARCRNACVRRHDVTAHAEILALRAAGKALGNYRLGGCVLIVTLEPCPMCAAAIVQARLEGVVFGACDARAGAVVSRAEYLDAPAAENPVWHMGGILAEPCAALLREFFAIRRSEGAA